MEERSDENLQLDRADVILTIQVKSNKIDDRVRKIRMKTNFGEGNQIFGERRQRMSKDGKERN